MKTDEQPTVRQGIRTITMRYATKPEVLDERYEVCQKLVALGITPSDYSWDISKHNPEAFQEVKETKTRYSLTLKSDKELVWFTDYQSDIDSIMEAMPDVFTKSKVKYDEISVQTYAGGSNQHLFTCWSDLNDSEFDDGFSISLDGVDIAGRGDTVKGSLSITIVGPSNNLDSEFVENAVAFLTHRWDSVYRALGFGQPIFDCEVNLSYNKKLDCDVKWLVDALPSDAKEEEE